MKTFISYSHRDRRFLDSVIPHLISFQREANDFVYWYDDSLRPGDSLNSKIIEEIESSALALLFISANYISSHYCFEMELPLIGRRYRNGQMRVIPIICEACNWRQLWLGDLVTFPSDGTSLSEYERFDLILTKLHNALRHEMALLDNKHEYRSGLSEIGVSLVIEHPRGSGFHVISYSEYLMIKIKNSILDRVTSLLGKDVAMDWNLNEFGKERIEVSIYERGRLRSRYEILLWIDPVVSVVVHDVLAGREEVHELYYDEGQFFLRMKNRVPGEQQSFEAEEFVDRLVFMIVK